mmetsp:Transcript_32371/g.62502  ORF Transcript_32371/g.62502 Transcript_32371/m.62502 type:complete len:88 (+) Transcript_32371:464-727(+)
MRSRRHELFLIIHVPSQYLVVFLGPVPSQSSTQARSVSSDASMDGHEAALPAERYANTASPASLMAMDRGGSLQEEEANAQKAVTLA